jgi:putative DNA primase/helicase
MMDFNDAIPASSPHDDSRREEIRTSLLSKLESVLTMMFPAGKVKRGKFLIGDILGSPGDSLEIVLTGDKAGLWTDRENGSGGDQYDLIGGHYGINVQTDFPAVLVRAADLAGAATPIPARKRKVEVPTDDLGKATAKWDYLDAAGKLIAIVYRYDPPGQKKEFRPWDVKRKKAAPPNPRPLYNQSGMLNSDQVVLVEGEKCAQSLIDAGVCATTAMFGANAPVEKTDWSPLTGKAVIIWPDKDKPGWSYAENAAQAILMAKATSCVILYPPEGKSDGWDCADAVAEGLDVIDIVQSSPRMTMHLPDIGADNQSKSASGPGEGDPEPTVWGSDDALALSFTKRYQEDWRYVAAWGKWLIWDGQRWRSEDTLAASDLVRHVCRFASLKSRNPKLAAKLAASSTIGGVERLARSDRRHAGTTDEWDADVWALNTPGGVVDLHTGGMRSHQRSDRMTKIATATPRGQCPTWLRFLSDITNGDQELIDYLQVMVGYCLTGVTSEHALFFLYGTGANGKSVFVNVISTILGDYAANAPMDTFMETRGDRHPTDLAGLRGARFVSSIETEQGRSWNESKVKAITGGDKVSARFMRQDFFEYFPQFKLIIAGNHKPSIRNVDEAMKRRLHLIPFTVTIPAAKRDGKLTEKLLMERDAIMAWAVEGCMRWQATGLNPPASVVAATDEYFDEEDAIGEFIAAEAQVCAPAKVSVADVFARWQEWSSKRGEYVGTSRWLAQQLANRGFARTRIHGGVKALSGLSLKAKDYGIRLPYADD